MSEIPKTSSIFKNVIQNLPKICVRSIFTWIINPFCLIETESLKYFSHWIFMSSILNKLLSSLRSGITISSSESI